MLEILLCSLLTVLPDYLYPPLCQGKRIGKEITLYSVWFELRWGITGCLILTVGLITVIFYNHPSTTNVTLFFRTIPIISETTDASPRSMSTSAAPSQKGAPIFRLDSSKQEAAVETARRKIAEVEAEMEVARADILKAEGQLQEAKGAYQQALDELETKQELQKTQSGDRPVPRDREAPGRRRRPQGRDRCRHRGKADRRRRGSRPAPGAKGQRRSGAGPGGGGTGKDRGPRRRERARGAVRAPGRAISSIRSCVRPGVLIPEAPVSGPAGRLRADRSADHEGRNDRRGHVCIQALDGHPDGGHRRAGLHRGRPVPRRRATGRPAAGDAAGYTSGPSRAALQRRARKA